jgi:hypothetical protein
VKIMNYLGVCIANLVGTQNCNDLYFAPLFWLLFLFFFMIIFI